MFSVFNLQPWLNAAEILAIKNIGTGNPLYAIMKSTS